MHAFRKRWHVRLQHIIGNQTTNYSTTAQERSNADERDSNRTLQPTSTSLIIRYSSVGKIARQINFPSGRTASSLAIRKISRNGPTHVPSCCTSRLRPSLRVAKPIFAASHWFVTCDGGITTARYPRRLTESKQTRRNGQSITASDVQQYQFRLGS